MWKKWRVPIILIQLLNSNLIYFSLPTFNRFHLPDLKPKLPTIKTDKNKIVSKRPFPISSHHSTTQTAAIKRPLKLNGPQSSMTGQLSPPPLSSENGHLGQQSLSQRPGGSESDSGKRSQVVSNAEFNEFNEFQLKVQTNFVSQASSWLNNCPCF